MNFRGLGKNERSARAWVVLRFCFRVGSVGSARSIRLGSASLRAGLAWNLLRAPLGAKVSLSGVFFGVSFARCHVGPVLGALNSFFFLRSDRRDICVASAWGLASMVLVAILISGPAGSWRETMSGNRARVGHQKT